MNERINTRSHLDGSEVRWEGRRKPKLKLRRPGPMVVWVEGRECLKVPLTRGLFAIIDKSDADFVVNFNWYAFKWTHGFYAARKIRLHPGKCVTQFMHNVIAPCSTGYQPDHRNGNGLDNRRTNLRIGTVSQNRFNAEKRTSPTSSSSKGVHWLNRERRWRAKIQFYKQEINLGYFKTEQEAVAAYHEAAQNLFGQFAVHNRQTLSGQ